MSSGTNSGEDVQVEYPTAENGLSKKHQNSGCAECVFASDKKTLLIFMVDRKIRQAAGYDPIFVGKFTMPGWVGHSRFYLFKCWECNVVCVDYPHGYTSRGCIYLRCDNCLSQLVINPDKGWGEEIYAREGIVAPPKSKSGKTFMNCLKFLRRYFS